MVPVALAVDSEGGVVSLFVKTTAAVAEIGLPLTVPLTVPLPGDDAVRFAL